MIYVMSIYEGIDQAAATLSLAQFSNHHADSSLLSSSPLPSPKQVVNLERGEKLVSIVSSKIWPT